MIEAAGSLFHNPSARFQSGLEAEPEPLSDENGEKLWKLDEHKN